MVIFLAGGAPFEGWADRRCRLDDLGICDIGCGPVAAIGPHTPMIRVPHKLIAYFFLPYLGNPGAYAFHSMAVAAVIGLITLATMFVLARRVIRLLRLVTPYRAFLMALYLLCLLSAVSAAVSRFELGIDQAVSSRYTLPALLSWICLFLLALDLAPSGRWRHLALGFGSIGIISLAIIQLQAHATPPGLYERKLAVLSHKIGLDRPPLLDRLMPAGYRESPAFAADAGWAIKEKFGFFGSLPWLRA